MFEHFRKESVHAEVFNILIDVLDDRESTPVQEAQDVHQRFQVVFSAHGLQVDHSTWGKQTVAVETLDRLLLAMGSILMVDLTDQGEVNDGVLVVVFIIADILELQVAMGVSDTVNNFQLWN